MVRIVWRRRMVWLAMFLCAQGWLAQEAAASLDGEIQAHEVAILPKYCPHTQLIREKFGTKHGVAYWTDRLGRPFTALHHYCWALIAINRANKFNATHQEKRFNYFTATAEIDYVIRSVKEDFVLMPEMLTRRGEAYTKLKNYSAAEADFRWAIRLKADYWPAFLGLAQSFLTQGKKDAARAILNDGIKTASDPRALQTLLSQIDKTK